jgi:pimeloyl-[acyl-carrier protein] synthase
MIRAMAWNPLDPELAPDPYSRYAALREADPVYFEEALGWWFVTGHEEGVRVLREPGGEQRFDEFQRMRMGRDVSHEPYCRGLRSFVMAVGPEDHKRIRSTFQRHFTPNRVEAMRESTIAAAEELIRSLEPRGEADLVSDYALPLPLISISALLAIPVEEQGAILAHLTHFKRAVQFLPMDEEALAKANATIAGLEQEFTKLIARRRRDLGDDLLSMLIRDADDGVLTEDELVANAWGLFAGGYDTTGGAIANGMIELLDHPEQLTRLRDDPSLVPNAVQELIRCVGPVQAQHRVFPHPVEIGGHTIPPDTPVVTYLIGANRDPRFLNDPDELDVERREGRNHLAFGDGKRKCPGRHLASMTMEVALSALIGGLGGLRLAGPVEWDLENLPALAPKSVPIAWNPA